MLLPANYLSENIDTIPGLFQSAGSYSQRSVKANPIRRVHLPFLRSRRFPCAPASWVLVCGIRVCCHIFGWDSHQHTLLKSQPRTWTSYPRMPLSLYDMHTLMFIQNKSSINKYWRVQSKVLIIPSFHMIKSFSCKNALQYVLKSRLWKIKTPLIKLVGNKTKENES